MTARELEALGIGCVVRVAGDNTHTLQCPAICRHKWGE